ncbi:Ig-like domain-containing protein [Acinetobacter sp. P8-3-8]|uniref:Ig-like domain-containing protein n=1 Tax=Acinetobacter sp. P8-3-8 TaxID=1029823 RepID=UPI0002485559|nr:Ig-like domain-containing protein [Acinetobacter sp. P8-3-8]
MASLVYSVNLMANSTAKIFIGSQEIGSFTVRPNGYFSRMIPYDNGETVTLVGIDKQGLNYSYTFIARNSHSSDTPTTIEIHDDVHTVTGSAEANSVIRITDSNGSIVGIATANYQGKFTVSTAPLQPGEQLNIIATDNDGNVSQAAHITVPQPVALISDATTHSLTHLLGDEAIVSTQENTAKAHPSSHSNLDQVISHIIKEQGITENVNPEGPKTTHQDTTVHTELVALTAKNHSFDELIQAQQHLV